MSTRRSRITQNKTSRNVTAGTSQASEEIVNLADVKEQAQDFYQKYQKLIVGIVGGLVLLVGGYLAYKFLYIQPKEKSAVEAMYQAELQFAKDSFAAALDNPGGGFEGFAAIADGELTWLYVAPSRYKQGIGRRLLRHAIKAAKGDISTEVLVGNEPALALYLSEGFKIVRRVDGKLAGNESFAASGYELKFKADEAS